MWYTREEQDWETMEWNTTVTEKREQNIKGKTENG